MRSPENFVRRKPTFKQTETRPCHLEATAGHGPSKKLEMNDSSAEVIPSEGVEGALGVSSGNQTDPLSEMQAYSVLLALWKEGSF